MKGSRLSYGNGRGGGGGVGVMHGRSLLDHRPSDTCNAGTEYVAFSTTNRQAFYAAMGEELLISCVALVMDPRIPTMPGRRRSFFFSDQADIACTKREAPSSVRRVA